MDVGRVAARIDIMEHVGFDPDVVHASVHTKAYNHNINTHKTATTRVPNACTGFNVYAIEWDAQEIRAYVNQQHYFTFKNERLTNPAADFKQWPFDKAFHLLLNIAVGGTWGGQKGVDETIWPQRWKSTTSGVYKSAERPVGAALRGRPVVLIGVRKTDGVAS
jgi:licheninase